MQHILVLNRSFWPDIEATGQFFTEFCEQLAKKYRVSVIAGCSYYVKKDAFWRRKIFNQETFKGIEIVRVNNTIFWKANFIGRMINWLTYGAFAFFALLGTKSDLIIVGTDPPFLGIIAMLIKRLKSIPFVYNCRDLYPDVALELKKLKPGLVSKLFDYLNIRALNSSRLVICLGRSMQERLKAKGVPEGHIAMIPDWADTAKIRPVAKSDNPLIKQFGLEDKFILMYSGNIGISQDFSQILHALTLVEKPDYFYLVFVGEGAGKRKLKAQVSSIKLKNVLFLPYQPQETLSLSLGMADLHLISLKKGMAGAVIPSKIYGIMAVGRPYLAIIDKESEPAFLAREFGCGLWADNGDVRAISNIFDWALGHRQELEEMGKIGRQVAEVQFAKDKVIEQWLVIPDTLSKNLGLG